MVGFRPEFGRLPGGVPGPRGRYYGKLRRAGVPAFLGPLEGIGEAGEVPDMQAEIGFFEPRWRPRAGVALAAVALLVLVSLVVPAGQAGWQELDRAAFLFLNGSLAEGGAWATFWAWANYRPVDLLSAAIMLAFLVLPGPVFRPSEVRLALFGFFSLLFLGLIVREVLDYTAELLGLVGPSPSLLYEPAHRLSELVPELATKDSSKESFPGDHASVLLCWALYLLIRRPGAGSVLATCIALLLMLPRLVAGAHAVSDVLVGGVFIAFLTLALGYCTPYHGRAAVRVTGWFEPLVEWLARMVPPLRWFSFFRASGSG